MSAANHSLQLDSLINPRSIALIGASTRSERLTSRPLRFLLQHGFKGDLYPVTPVYERVNGLPAFDCIKAIPGPVDFAYILRDAVDAVALFEQCALKGVKVACIVAGGFSEAGEPGIARQRLLQETAQQYGIRLIGPNSTGVVNTHNGFVCTTNAAFEMDRLIAGRIAVISQSGSLIGTVVSRGRASGIGYSVLASVGNEADVTFSEIGIALLDDVNTQAIVIVLETIRDLNGFVEFARKAYDAGKPVFAFTIGQSSDGKVLTSTHTGAITGKSDALHSFLRSHGVHCLDVFDSIIELPAAQLHVTSKGSGSNNRTVTIVSTTGGGGTILVDKLSDTGAQLSSCSRSSRELLAKHDIRVGHGKLIDITMAGTNPKTLGEVVTTLLVDPHVDILLIVLGSSARLNPDALVETFGRAQCVANDNNKTIVVFPLPDAPELLRQLNAIGVACFRTVETCAEFIWVLTSRQKIESSASIDQEVSPVRPTSSGVLNEVQALELFESLGLPGTERIVVNAVEALPESLPFSYPCVAKIVSSDIPHKTEFGAVALNVASLEHLEHSLKKMCDTARDTLGQEVIEGLMVQPMQTGVCELLLGFHRDPVVGPVVTLAFGGVFAEIYKDKSLRPAPVSEATAGLMIRELKAYPLLVGYRNRPVADVEALCHAVAKFSCLASVSEICEAEINPLLVRQTGNGIVMLDGLARLV